MARKQSLPALTEQDLEALPIGAAVSQYGAFANLTYQGRDDRGQVILHDASGNPKAVFASLFLKHAVMAPLDSAESPKAVALPSAPQLSDSTLKQGRTVSSL